MIFGYYFVPLSPSAVNRRRRRKQKLDSLSAGWRYDFVGINNGNSWLSIVSGNVGNSQDTV